ncbi:MAG: hypothetical protein ABFD97_16545 [Syntrophobacter sp.]
MKSGTEEAVRSVQSSGWNWAVSLGKFAANGGAVSTPPVVTGVDLSSAFPGTRIKIN